MGVYVYIPDDSAKDDNFNFNKTIDYCRSKFGQVCLRIIFKF